MKTVKLKDVAISCDSGTWGDEVSENIVGNPVLRSSNIDDFKLKLDDFAWRQIPEKDIERKKLQNGDIIITASSGSSHLIGKCAYFTQPKDKYNYYFSNFTLRLRGDSEKINPKFLFYWLISNQARSYLQGADNTTSGLRNLNKTIYLDQPVPLPPLPEQKRIAEVLDKADALREKRRLALQKLDTLLQSVFLEMFGDPVKNPMGWEIKKLSDLGLLARGKSKHRPRNAPELLGGIYPLIQTGDVSNANSYIRDYNQTYSEIGLKQSRMWKAGTLCITIAANIGKTAILTFDACFPDSVVGFTPNDLSTTEYIQYWLMFKQKELEDNAPESAQKNINLEILNNLTLQVSPKELQNKFTKMVLKIEETKEKYRQTENNVENLFQSLQQKAFKGELFEKDGREEIEEASAG